MRTPPREPADFPGLWVNAQPVVRSFILGAVRNLHDAEDILQEVARSAFMSFDRYDPARPFTPWVMIIARRRVIDHLRTRPAQTTSFDEHTLTALAHAHESLSDIAHARRAALGDCMSQVHARGRHVLQLRHVEGEAVKDIAEQMQTTPHAISVLLYKVKTALAQCIDRKLKTEETSR